MTEPRSSEDERDPRSYESAVLHQTERDLGWVEPAAVASGWDRFWSAVEKIPVMTGTQYANEVLRIVSDGTIRITCWSGHERDALLDAIRDNYQDPAEIELILDNPATANFRLMPDLEDPHRVQVADYRLSVITRRAADPAVAEVNRKLRAIGRNH